MPAHLECEVCHARAHLWQRLWRPHIAAVQTEECESLQL
jgi:hypothetical protein